MSGRQSRPEMDEFLWGSATAAYQCEGAWQEGGKGLSNWDVFCHSAANDVNPVTGDVSCDHYHRFEEDLDLMVEGGQNAYRFSVAWTRVIPDGTGKVCEEGLAFYDRLVDACLERGIEPVVTLYHYDMPEGLFAAGGWERREVVDAFVAYAHAVLARLGDRVRWWTTINEPSYDTLCCYVAGNYPPNVQDCGRRFRAMYHQLLASARTVQAFRRLREAGAMRADALIGLVSDSYPIESRGSSPEDQAAVEAADLFFNRAVNDLCVLGRFPEGLRERLAASGWDTSYALPQDEADFRRGTVEFLGINAYERILVKPPVSGETHYGHNNTGTAGARIERTIGGWFTNDTDPDVPKNAWGMEILPRSIYDLLLDLSRRYPDTPFLITENGVGWDEAPAVDGRVHDDYRIDYLSGYVDWIGRARAEGVDVRGYLVWSTMDLYSWINGYRKRYGLIYVDFDDEGLGRTPKDSFYWYRDMIKGKDW